MSKAYVKIDSWGYDKLLWGNGEVEYVKDLRELLSYWMVVGKTDKVEADRLKKLFCEYISEDIGELFTVEMFDRVVKDKHYKRAWSEFVFLNDRVKINEKRYKEGKPLLRIPDPLHFMGLGQLGCK